MKVGKFAIRLVPYYSFDRPIKAKDEVYVTYGVVICVWWGKATWCSPGFFMKRTGEILRREI